MDGGVCAPASARVKPAATPPINVLRFIGSFRSAVSALEYSLVGQVANLPHKRVQRYGSPGKLRRVRSSGGFARKTLPMPPASAAAASPHTMRSTVSKGLRNATATTHTNVRIAH